MSVYQQIKNRFLMKNAREDWADYRARLTELVLDQSPRSILVIGAGRCNDIDLRRLAEAAERVILFDVDGDAIREAVEELPPMLQKKLECRTGSLTGIEESHMEGFCEEMLSYARSCGKKLTGEGFRSHLKDAMNELTGHLIREGKELRDLLPEAEAEVIMCCGVHSQLFSQMSFFIRSLLMSLQELLPETEPIAAEAADEIRRMDDQVIPCINRALMAAAGRLIIFGNEYMPDSPVEGAYQCIRDVREHMDPRELHLHWNFNPAERISYDMLIQICGNFCSDH